MDTRKLGYVLIIFFLGVMLTVLSYAVYILAFPADKRVIAFEQVGNLRVDDPVKIKGVTVGKIHSIEKNDALVLVTFYAESPLKIYKDYAIITSDRGIMGDRLIHIDPGKHLSSPVDGKDTLKGVFIRGISEMIGSAYKVKDIIASTRSIASKLLMPTPPKRSFPAVFWVIMNKLDTVSNSLCSVANALETDFTPTIDTLSRAVVSARKSFQDVSGDLPRNLAFLREQTDTLIVFLNDLDTLATKLTDVTAQVSENNLISKDETTPLLAEMKKVRQTLHNLQIGALHFRGKLIWGFEE